jgi:hypothetical protein
MRVPGVETVVFGLVALLFAAGTVQSVRRLATVARTLRRGVRTEGRCVRVQGERHSDATRHFFAFTAADGTEVEFEELAKWSVGPGDPVTVVYDPQDPRRTATTAGRNSWSPVLQRIVLAGGCALGTAAFVTLFLVRLLGGS